MPPRKDTTIGDEDWFEELKMPTYGSVETFSGDAAEWNNYSERLEQYFIANDLEEIVLTADNQAEHTSRQKKRRAILLSVLGANTYEVLRNLCLPQKPAEKTYNELIQLLETHYSPKPSETVQRYKFNTRQRKADESIATYVAELRHLAEHCKFGTILEDMLRDRLVCGVNNERIQRLLLLESELTLDKAFKIASAQEAAESDVIVIQGTAACEENVNSLRQTSTRQSTPNATSRKRNNRNVKCYRCAEIGHFANKCKHINSNCDYCKKVGHIMPACRKKERDSSVRENDVNEIEETDKSE